MAQAKRKAVRKRKPVQEPKPQVIHIYHHFECPVKITQQEDKKGWII